jgi:hypothetical protein
MKPVLEALVIELESCLPSLEANRATIALANDCYEAAYGWCGLGRRAIEADTRVNYAELARGERMLLARLNNVLESKPIDEQRIYAPVLRAGSELVEIVSTVQPPPDGHLNFLRIVRGLFSFLQTAFHFKESETQPGSIQFSSGVVYLELDGLAQDPWMSCSFGLESPKPHNFWIHDLLYLNHDERYLHLPERLEMKTESDLEEWFGLVAGIMKQYGAPIFEGNREVFESLSEAQMNRDKEYALEMERRFGSENLVKQFDELTSRLGRVNAGRHFTRDEMNER